MKKRRMISLAAVIAIACIIVIIFIRFGNKGNISNVKRVIGYSALYDEELINKAFDAVEDKFASDFDTGIKSQDLGFTPNETYEGWRY